MEGESRAYQIETDDVIRGPSEAISGRYQIETDDATRLADG
jgi:hypothetical protein